MRKRSDEKSTCGAVENSDLSTAKSTGCGKVEISTRVFNRVWKTVLIIYICRKLPLWKRQWETFGKGCKAFFLCYFNPHPPVTFQSTSPCNISIHVPTVVREEERTSPFQINYIDCGRRLLLRGGRTEGFRRHPSASTGFRWSLA